MAGTGKRADQKKTLVIKLYGNKYFGKQGVTSRRTAKKKEKVLNIKDIVENIKTWIKKRGKKTAAGIELNLQDYKLLAQGEASEKLKGTIIKVKAASKSAIEKIEKVGGKIVVK